MPARPQAKRVTSDKTGHVLSNVRFPHVSCRFQCTLYQPSVQEWLLERNGRRKLTYLGKRQQTDTEM